MKRPDSHVTGDIGIARVAQAFVSSGWACDPVISDYGEDLILQTTLNGEVDPFRTLVQVKSTRRFRAKRKAARFSIGLNQALRWVRSAEPVLFIVWDTERKRAWYAIPADQFHEIDLLLSSRRSARLELESAGSLTSKTLHRWAWDLRLRYHANRIRAAEEQDRAHLMLHDTICGRVCTYKTASAPAVFELLRQVKVITPRGIASRLRRTFTNAKRNLKEHHPDEGPDFHRQGALMLALLGHVEDVTGVGLPTTALTAGAEYLEFFLRTERKRRTRG